MKLKFLIVLVMLFLSTSFASAESKTKHKGKVASTTAAKSTSETKISVDQFSMLAYWTILGFYENNFDRTNAVALRLSKSFVVGCSLDLQMLMFKQNEKWLDLPTYLKRGLDLINSSIDLDDLKAKNCRPPTKELAKKVILDPRPFTSLDDIRLDSASLQGHDVMIEATGIYMMNQFLLKSNMQDLNPVLVDIQGLDVDNRKWILQKCGNMMAPCNVIVSGSVGDGASPEVIANMVYPNESI